MTFDDTFTIMKRLLLIYPSHTQHYYHRYLTFITCNIMKITITFQELSFLNPDVNNNNKIIVKQICKSMKTKLSNYELQQSSPLRRTKTASTLASRLL